ncbi:MAG: CDP-alcohol phosphatidyltransferase family protein, partial [Candidatus Hodarchaeales archaeon]
MADIDKYILIAYAFTFINAVSGLIGILIIILNIQNLPFVPLQLIIIGAIFDFLDGFMAKRSEFTSEFGVYADSISDILTFAILPGLMILNTNLIGTNDQGLFSIIPYIIAGIYSLSGWVRLVRFASNPTGKHFEGLPSPAAALLMGTCATISNQDMMPWLFGVDGLILSIFALFIAILMVVSVPYPSPKRGFGSDLILIGVAGVIVIIFVIFPNLVTILGVFV